MKINKHALHFGFYYGIVALCTFSVLFYIEGFNFLIITGMLFSAIIILATRNNKYINNNTQEKKYA